VLHPTAQDYELARKPNALACVLRVQGAETSMLLTGDIEHQHEAALVASYRDALRTELLLVAHHGSRTSSSAAFLDTVQPRRALIQAGYRHRFGHPVAEVLQRNRERGIEVRVSPACGSWMLDAAATPGGLCQREAVQRRGHHGGAP
jgi:competence protein ComEC